MSKALLGGCLCGEIRYECTGQLQIPVYCHCRDCQKSHSAPFAAEASVASGSIVYTKGQPARFTMKANSGSDKHHEFCPACATILVGWSDAYPEVKMIQLVSLDDPELVQPVAHLFTESAISLACLNDGLPQFKTMPSVKELELLATGEQ